MRAFLLRRLLQNAILLLFISVIVYGILYLVPGGPFDQLNFGATSATAAAAQVKRLNELFNRRRTPIPWVEHLRLQPAEESFAGSIVRRARFARHRSNQIRLRNP